MFLPEKCFFSSFQSPVGTIHIVADNEVLHKLYFGEGLPENEHTELSNGVIGETQKQLSLYFAKKPYCFDLPFAENLTEFQQRVLDEVKKIPHGQTITYTQLAKRMGSVKLSRAVAAANASNPFLILVPCHRVVGKNNDLTGYAGQVWRKQWLLHHEGALNMLLPQF